MKRAAAMVVKRMIFWCLGATIVIVGEMLFSATTLSDETAAPTGEEIERLIAELVSPNKKPIERAGDLRYAPDYNREAQESIRRKFSALYRIGLPAFPYLLKHRTDRRYSFSEDAGFAMENWSVGRACRDIIDCHLQPFGIYPFALGEGDPLFRPRRPIPLYGGGVEAWLEGRKGKSLRELQLEVLDGVIAEEEMRPQDYTAKERNYLKDLHDKLRASDQPLSPAYPFAK